MRSGYLFDLDGTLVTYDPGTPGIFENACREAGVEPTEAALEAIGPGYVETFREFEESPYVGAARAAREAGLAIDPRTFAAHYVEAELAATRVPDGTANLLSELSPVGVVTNGYGPVQRRKLSETGLDDRIDAVVCADDVEAFKPDDEPFDAIEAAIDASEYVVVGDSIEYDVQPANERGHRTVFVGPDTETGGEADGSGSDATPDIRLEDPSELASLRNRF